MKQKLLAGLLFAALLITACGNPKKPSEKPAENITTVNQTLKEIQELDESYNTSFKFDMVHKVTLQPAQIRSYLNDLDKLEGRVSPESEDQAR